MKKQEKYIEKHEKYQTHEKTSKNKNCENIAITQKI